MRSLRTFEQPL